MIRSVLPALAAFALAVAPLAAQTPPPAPPADKPAVSAASPLPLTPEQSAKLLAAGKKYAVWFLGGQTDSLAKALDPKLSADIGGANGLMNALTQLTGNAGTQQMVIEQKMTRRNGWPQFWHEAKFSAAPEDGVVVLRLVLDADAKIIGMGMNPKSRAPAPDA